MGLNDPNIYQCIHYGPPESIEAYLQETGHCGRDRTPSSAVLYYSSKHVSGTSEVSDSMKGYCGNDGYCRRKLLLTEFAPSASIECPSPIHRCCDVCKRECDCEGCSTSRSESSEPLQDQTVSVAESQAVKPDKQLQLEK